MKTKKLTVPQLVTKFPAMLKGAENENCLEDMACPVCGQRERFKIEMKAIIEIRDEGTEDHGDTDWDGNSWCECPESECRHEGKARDFKFKGLDAYIYKNRVDNE